MSANRETVERYMEGFRRSDHGMILSCLAEDVVWDLPGAYHLVGKDAFDREISNPAFAGCPTITVLRTVEEGNVVVAEGKVQARKADGGTLDAVFCDVFEMEDGLILHLTSYLMEIAPARSGTGSKPQP